MSARLKVPADVVIVDGCALLWTVHWQCKGTVQNIVDEFYEYVNQKMNSSDVYLVFDRYYKYSIKGSARKERVGNMVHRHQFSKSTASTGCDSNINRKQSSNHQHYL